MGVALKWFPDKRGLAAGITAAAFGGGTALFIPAIASILRSSDYHAAFLYTGVGQGLLIVCAAQFLRSPLPGEVPAVTLTAKSRVRRHQENFTPSEMMRTPHFYVLYLTMLMMGVGGLMVTAQLGPLAGSFKISATILTVAATMNPIANGASRLFWGWVSDHMGRERTMIVAFLIQALALMSVPLFAHGSNTAFIVCLMLVYFSWGEIYSLFPSLSADLFGSGSASANYGFLYSTKGVASIVGGGLAALLFEKIGNWDVVFYGSAVLALISTLIAIGLTKMPMPRKPQPVALGVTDAQGAAARG
jgi:OFA family oxalate/formate antiporter-like MFS transporter